MKLNNNNIDFDYKGVSDRYWRQYLVDYLEVLYENDCLDKDIKNWLDVASEQDIMLFIDKILDRFNDTDYSFWKEIDTAFRDSIEDTYYGVE